MVSNVVAIMLWTRLIDTPTDPWETTWALAWHRGAPLALVSFALAPVFIWDAIRLTNRFAGPIVRVRRALTQIADGQAPSAIEFRKGDLWKSLALDLNRAVVKTFANETVKAGCWQPNRRRGAALVEFAVCLPVLMILILGSMEASSAIFVRQSLTTSAYEGIREAIRIGSNTANATNRAQTILTTRQIRNSTIRFTPSIVETAAKGTLVAIEVSAPYKVNSPFFGNVIADRTTTVRTVMVKE